MASLTQEAFEHLLVQAAYISIDVAQAQVVGALPQKIRWELLGFERSGKESSLDEIVAILYRNGAFPVIVDVFVAGVLDAFTLIRLVVSGHELVDDIAKTWNTPVGMGPFKSLGLMLPNPIWQRPRPLSLDDLREAAAGWPME